jgi:hypothetical protein
VGGEVGDNNLSKNIADGKSFDRAGPLSLPSPYYYSTNGHGTLMAKLICRVCPVVKLYVAKLDTKGETTDTGRFTARCAAEVLTRPVYPL